MLIHILSIVLLIVSLSMIQAAACKQDFLLKTSLRLVVLGACIVSSSTHMFAVYSQSLLDAHASKLWSLPEEYLSDNKFNATLNSAKFTAKDQLDLDITFSPNPDYKYDGSPTPTKRLSLNFGSPYKASGFRRAPMIAAGVLIWVVTFGFGWLLKPAFNPKTKHPENLPTE